VTHRDSTQSTATISGPGQAVRRDRPLRRLQLRVLAGTTGAAMLLPVAPLLALARPDPGNPVTPSSEQRVRVLGNENAAQTHCPLMRVDTQLVRCDDLTGNGAVAPNHIPERR
jgi:hypothetical protein